MTSGVELSNVEALMIYFSKLAASDMSAADYYHEDLSYWVCPGTDYSGSHSKAKMVDVLLPQFFGSQAAPVRFDFSSITAQEDRVHVSAMGKMPLKNGTDYDNDFSWLFRFKDGKIISVREFYTPS